MNCTALPGQTVSRTNVCPSHQALSDASVYAFPRPSRAPLCALPGGQHRLGAFAVDPLCLFLPSPDLVEPVTERPFVGQQGLCLEPLSTGVPEVGLCCLEIPANEGGSFCLYRFWKGENVLLHAGAVDLSTTEASRLTGRNLVGIFQPALPRIECKVMAVFLKIGCAALRQKGGPSALEIGTSPIKTGNRTAGAFAGIGARIEAAAPEPRIASTGLPDCRPIVPTCTSP
jgi:hypothetical protein